MANPVICFDFTANNMHPDICKNMLKEHCKKWVFQQEKAPRTGTLHLQGRMWLKVKARLDSTVKKFPGFHLSITSKENSKNDYYATKEETRVAGPWSSKDAKERYIPRQVAGIILKPWQQHIVSDANVWDTRTINVIVDSSGNIGKSTLATYIGCHQIGMKIPFSNEFKDIMQMVMCVNRKRGTATKLFLFDMPRALRKDQLYQFYAGIEELKNGYAFDNRYKFREQYFDCPNIWVFSNKYPDTDLLSMDRWKVWRVEDEQLVPYSTLELNLSDAKINPKLTSTTPMDIIDDAEDNVSDNYCSWDEYQQA